jgi:hypothetical protein
MRPHWNKKVLVLVDGLGDCIAATPAIGAFKKEFPNTELYVLTWRQHGCAEVFEYHPDIKRTFPIDGSFEYQYRKAQELGFRVEEIAVLDNIVHYAQFCQKCGNPNIDRWIHALTSIHADLIDIYFLNLLGRTPLPTERGPRIYVVEDDLKYARRFDNFKPYIFVNYNTRTELERKTWPMGNWNTLLGLIIDNFPKLNIVTVGNSTTPILPLEDSRVKHVRDATIRECWGIAANSSYSLCVQSGLAWLLECVPEVPGLQINIGSPSKICGRKASNCLIIDQKEVFGGHTISLDDVWLPLERDLKEKKFDQV